MAKRTRIGVQDEDDDERSRDEGVGGDLLRQYSHLHTFRFDDERISLQLF
jgi:hypothetical protein